MRLLVARRKRAQEKLDEYERKVLFYMGKMRKQKLKVRYYDAKMEKAIIAGQPRKAEVKRIVEI